ncbi:MAG: hypothetical protein M3162_07435 [Thermoproteota archaeon]|nr:hypothetical protein [Thermoproteota archaeon]
MDLQEHFVFLFGGTDERLDAVLVVTAIVDIAPVNTIIKDISNRDGPVSMVC